MIAALREESKVAAQVIEVDPQPSCEHIRFIYLNGEAFDCFDPELQKDLDAEEARQGEDFDMWDALKAHTGPDSLILEVTQDDWGCGPVSFTVWIGIRSPKRRSASAARGASARGGHQV